MWNQIQLFLIPLSAPRLLWSPFCVLPFGPFSAFFFFFGVLSRSSLSPRFGARRKRRFGWRELFRPNAAHSNEREPGKRLVHQSVRCQILAVCARVGVCLFVYVCAWLAVVGISAVRRSHFFFYSSEAVRRKFPPKIADSVRSSVFVGGGTAAFLCSVFLPPRCSSQSHFPVCFY